MRISRTALPPSIDTLADVVPFPDAGLRKALAQRREVDNPLHRTLVATPLGVATFRGYERVWFDFDQLEVEFDMFSIPLGDGIYGTYTRTQVLKMEDDYLRTVRQGSDYTH